MANVVIFGTQAWGPDELVALSRVLDQQLQLPLLFEEPMSARPDVLLRHLSVRSVAGEMFIQESVTYPLVEVPTIDRRLVGATITITMLDAELVGPVEASECFQALQDALGFDLTVITTTI